MATVLADFGYDPDEYDYDEASAILDELAKNKWQRPDREKSSEPRKPARGSQRRKTAPAQGGDGERSGPSGRQVAMLEKYGYDTDVTFEQASDIMDELASAGWPDPAEWSQQDDVPSFGR